MVMKLPWQQGLLAPTPGAQSGDRVRRAPGQRRGSRGTSGDQLRARRLGPKEQRTEVTISWKKAGSSQTPTHPQGITRPNYPCESLLPRPGASPSQGTRGLGLRPVLLRGLDACAWWEGGGALGLGGWGWPGPRSGARRLPVQHFLCISGLS